MDFGLLDQEDIDRVNDAFRVVKEVKEKIDSLRDDALCLKNMSMRDDLESGLSDALWNLADSLLLEASELETIIKGENYHGV